jgi:hypothetical protein
MANNNDLNNTTPSDFSVTTATAGTDRKLTISNTDNTNAASHSHLQLTSGGGAGGDPYINYLVTGAGTFSVGVDNSDSDKYKISANATLGTSDVFTIGSTTTTLLSPIVAVESSQVGSNLAFGVVNTDNTNAASSAANGVGVGGTSAGDPFFQLAITGSTCNKFGFDNSNSDVFNYMVGSTAGVAGLDGTIAVQITQSGEITEPLQPAFSAHLSTAATNVTGNGTVYGIICDTEVFDQGADYNNSTGVFTAPVTGRYFLEGHVYVYGTTIASGFGFNIVTSNRSYITGWNRTASNLVQYLHLSVIADMDAGDTAYITVQATGEAADTDDIAGNATDSYTGFSGNLEC